LKAKEKKNKLKKGNRKKLNVKRKLTLSVVPAQSNLAPTIEVYFTKKLAQQRNR
jgi:hypothetical protein